MKAISDKLLFYAMTKKFMFPFFENREKIDVYIRIIFGSAFERFPLFFQYSASKIL